MKDEHGIDRKYTHSFSDIPADRWDMAFGRRKSPVGIAYDKDFFKDVKANIQVDKNFYEIVEEEYAEFSASSERVEEGSSGMKCVHNNFEYRENAEGKQERFCLDCSVWFGTSWWCACLDGDPCNNPDCGAWPDGVTST